MSAQSWLQFVEGAQQVAPKCLPLYANKFSPRRFTLPQLAASVLLKEYRHLDWRAIEVLLAISRLLRRCLRLQAVLDHSTIWRFAQRWLDVRWLGQLLG